MHIQIVGVFLPNLCGTGIINFSYVNTVLDCISVNLDCQRVYFYLLLSLLLVSFEPKNISQILYGPCTAHTFTTQTFDFFSFFLAAATHTWTQTYMKYVLSASIKTSFWHNLWPFSRAAQIKHCNRQAAAMLQWCFQCKHQTCASHSRTVRCSWRVQCVSSSSLRSYWNFFAVFSAVISSAVMCIFFIEFTDNLSSPGHDKSEHSLWTHSLCASLRTSPSGQFSWHLPRWR